MINPLALTMGDPAGIGGEIIAKAYLSGSVRAPFFCIDDPERLMALGLSTVEISHPSEAEAAFPIGVPVLVEQLATPAIPGQPDPSNAQATVNSISRAVEFAIAGDASAVVTTPINKKVLYDGARFSFPGHTEFLGSLAGVKTSVMMLAAPGLRVVPTTIHIPLSEAPKVLSTPLILETARILNTSLIQDFGISNPRIAVAGLNPHAGEGGAMGYEDLSIIAPAVRTLQEEGLTIFGPLPADTMFHATARKGYDAALCTYHDQALIPVKMLDFAKGVNITLGLPFIRTSPDHGTAYDIAGADQADPSSLIEALNTAAEMAERRTSSGAS